MPGLLWIQLFNTDGIPENVFEKKNSLEKTIEDGKKIMQNYPDCKELINPYSGIICVLKMLSAYYICCKFSQALQITFSMEANTMNPDQTAP